MHHEDTAIPTGYPSRDDLSIYGDGIQKDQVVGGGLITEHLVNRVSAAPAPWSPTFWN